MSNRFKGTADFTKESRNPKYPKKWKAIVTDTELNKKVKEEIITARDIDTAITIAKTLAKKCEEEYESNNGTQ